MLICILENHAFNTLLRFHINGINKCNGFSSSNRVFELYDSGVLDMSFEDDADDGDNRTDEEKGLSHGYEGDFKVGDKVKVLSSMIIYQVKEYKKDGFDPKGLIGIVDELVLYGRKNQTLCSAITPVKVKFEPPFQGVNDKIDTLNRKFYVHFAGDELEKVS